MAINDNNSGAKQLSDGNTSGTILGKSTSDLISFHGVTATDQCAFVTNTSGSLGNTNTQLTAVIAALVCKGLMAAS